MRKKFPLKKSDRANKTTEEHTESAESEPNGGEKFRSVKILQRKMDFQQKKKLHLSSKQPNRPQSLPLDKRKLILLVPYIALSRVHIMLWSGGPKRGDESSKKSFFYRKKFKIKKMRGEVQRFPQRTFSSAEMRIQESKSWRAYFHNFIKFHYNRWAKKKLYLQTRCHKPPRLNCYLLQKKKE